MPLHAGMIPDAGDIGLGLSRLLAGEEGTLELLGLARVPRSGRL